MSNTNDSQDVTRGKGFGYRTSTGKVCMQRCFECGLENYAMAVSSGLCAFCGFDANASVVSEQEASGGKNE